MICIDGHTFDDTLLSGGWVIDAGCRGFNLGFDVAYNRSMKLYPIKMKDMVYAIDIENFTEIPNGIRFKQAALSNVSGQTECYLFGNGTANFIKGINETPGNTEDRPVQTITVPSITLQDIYNEIGTDIDLLKLDIEGAEYLVLGEGFEPIPKQITVETHEHCHKDLHDKYWPSIFENLCKHYNAILHVREWPQYKFIDCLFIRKDLV
jgi:FkbM family methyltransferase